MVALVATDIIGDLTFGSSFHLLLYGKVSLLDTSCSDEMGQPKCAAIQKNQYIIDVESAAVAAAMRSTFLGQRNRAQRLLV